LRIVLGLQKLESVVSRSVWSAAVGIMGRPSELRVAPVLAVAVSSPLQSPLVKAKGLRIEVVISGTRTSYGSSRIGGGVFSFEKEVKEVKRINGLQRSDPAREGIPFFARSDRVLIEPLMIVLGLQELESVVSRSVWSHQNYGLLQHWLWQSLARCSLSVVEAKGLRIQVVISGIRTSLTGLHVLGGGRVFRRKRSQRAQVHCWGGRVFRQVYFSKLKFKF